MRPCATTTASKRLVPPSESQSNIKKSKRSPETPWPSKSKTSIDDLPDFVLVEILCRLPHNKFVFRCKCVCKRWSSLIFDEESHSRFLWLQSHTPKPAPVERTLIFRDAEDKRKFFMLPELDLPMFKTHNLPVLLGFGPSDYIETSSDYGPIVLGASHDLVLCCQEVYCQRNYYICNPYTKKLVRLPPTRRCYKEVRVGFICDPYYKEDVDDQKEESITCSGTIHVDGDYRYAIVRICPRSPFKFNVEIFSSKTGKWTNYVVHKPREGFHLESLDDSGGIAHNGMLYWWNANANEHFVIGLDPYTKTDERPRFRLIDVPAEIHGGEYAYLRVCRGRLRICNFFYAMPPDPNLFYQLPAHHIYCAYYSFPSMNVWELKDDMEGGSEWCNLTGTIYMGEMVSKNPLIRQLKPIGYHSRTPITVIAFDPNDDDILYLVLHKRIVRYNFREKNLRETILNTPYEDVVGYGRGVFPFELPRWPTPVPSILDSN